MNASEEMKAIRNKYNLTQKDVSELIGIPLRTLGSWEDGSRCPSEWILNLVIESIHNKMND